VLTSKPRIVFGDPRRAVSTLIQAPIVHSIDSWAHLRVDPITETRLIREGIFEFAFASADLTQEGYEFTPPSFKERQKSARMGQAVGVDVAIDVDLDISLQSLDKVSVWSQRLIRKMIFRFETKHFKQAYKGSWKIADVDNYFANKMF
jgi:hypothetical protein